MGLKLVETGVPGLDELLGGGFPDGRIILLIGGPGTGKTILASQFLYNGINQFDERAVYVSLDESKEHFLSEMYNFGWDFGKAEEDGEFVFIDATRMSRSAWRRPEFGGRKEVLREKMLQIDRLIDTLDTEIHRIGAKRVAVDTLETLFQRFPDPIERRVAVVDLVESLSDLGITTILNSNISRLSLEREVFVEEYLAHGVILMQTLFSNWVTQRALQVEKMRGVKINHNLVPYVIDRNGVEVFPDIILFSNI